MVIIRNWRASDDGLLVDALVERGWVTEDRYRNKFSDDGVVPGSIFVAESEGTVCGHLLVAFRTLLYAGVEVPAAIQVWSWSTNLIVARGWVLYCLIQPLDTFET